MQVFASVRDLSTTRCTELQERVYLGASKVSLNAAPRHSTALTASAHQPPSFAEGRVETSSSKDLWPKNII
jgi:hypothetical protein